jgi:antitoxin FitA
LAQILIRGLDDDTKRRLQSRARSHGRSMEAEVRDILLDAVKAPAKNSKGLGSDIKRLFDGIGLETGEQIKEWKGFELRSPFET